MIGKYKNETPLIEILKDGFYRNFEVHQTFLEAHEMKFVIDTKSIEEIWKLLSFQYEILTIVEDRNRGMINNNLMEKL